MNKLFYNIFEMSFKHDLIIMQKHLAVMHGLHSLDFKRFYFSILEKKILFFFFFNLFYFILLNILIRPFTNICLTFILGRKCYIFNSTNALKLYSTLTRILSFHILSEFIAVFIYVIM